MSKLFKRSHQSALVALILSSTLSACGGGGGGGGTAAAIPNVASGPANGAAPPILPSTDPNIGNVPSPATSPTITAYADSSMAPQAGLDPTTFEQLLSTVQPQSVSVGSALFLDTFQNSSASNWTTATPSAWNVCKPLSSSSLEYCGTTNGGDISSFAGQSSWTDYRVESFVYMKDANTNVGLISRAQDTNNYYQLELRPWNGKNSWFIWKKVKGTWTEITGGVFNYVPGTYYRLRFDVVGTSLTASISSNFGSTYTTLGTGNDSTFSSGKIGVRAWGGSMASFDVVSAAQLTNAAAVAQPSTTPSTASTPTAAPTARATVAPTSTPTPTVTAPPATYTTYYVSPNGSDSNNGLSPSAAWQTLNNLNFDTFPAGTHVLLQGGATFSGNLYFGPNVQGTTNNPIVVSTYGSGQASINSPCNKNGALFYDTSNVSLSNIIFTGCTSATPTNAGFNIWADDGKAHGNLQFNNVALSYYNFGIEAQSGSGTWSNISVSHSTVHDVQSTGIYMGGGTSNTYVGHTEVYNVRNGYGYGIYFYGTSNGLAEYNVSHDNGGSGAGYGQGISAEVSDSITIQYNETYNIQKGAHDGNGIIVDDRTTNCLVQYNYSHDNQDAGVNMTQNTTSGVQNANDVARFNLLVNNSIGLFFWSGNNQYPQNATAYNNTVIANDGQSSIYAFGYLGSVNLYNNLFVDLGSSSATLTTSNIGALTLKGNGYYQANGPFQFWYQTTASGSGVNFAGLPAFKQGTGQESGTGIEANPGFQLPASAPIVGIKNIDSMPSLLGAYHLPSNSAFTGSALNLQSMFGINPGTRDFFGNSYAKNIGA